jgi:putative phosphoribosyl transferase
MLSSNKPTEVAIEVGHIELQGALSLPEGATGLVLFAHGSGSSRHSPRNQFVAAELRRRGLGTLLFDLLTADEEALDQVDRHLRFDVDLLADRLVATTTWVRRQPSGRDIAIGYFGASTGAAAALIAAARRPEEIRAVVSRGGRPDLAGPYLESVQAPTLLIVGGEDFGVIELNEQALRALPGPKHMAIVPGATHLFEEPGALAEVARLAGDWFQHHLPIDRGITAGRSVEAR